METLEETSLGMGAFCFQTGFPALSVTSSRFEIFPRQVFFISFKKAQ